MTEDLPDLIALDQPRAGYRRFLGCWVRRSGDSTFIVDPGPPSTVGLLIDELRRRGVERLDLVLLTHVHLDHGGGAAEVLDAFPGARLHCHESGVKHVVRPDRLWEGSVAVLGDVAEMYGRPDPVAEDRLASAREVEDRGVAVIPTPGHAQHHVSFLHGGTLYAGEAFGTALRLPDGEIYLRPATPPRFFLDEAVASLDRLLALDPEPARTAFAHHGLAEGCFRYARAAREQILLWVRIVRELRAESEEDLGARLFARLMEEDPHCGRGRFDALDEDLRIRERHFYGNTLDGILSYLG